MPRHLGLTHSRRSDSPPKTVNKLFIFSYFDIQLSFSRLLDCPLSLTVLGIRYIASVAVMRALEIASRSLTLALFSSCGLGSCKAKVAGVQLHVNGPNLVHFDVGCLVQCSQGNCDVYAFPAYTLYAPVFGIMASHLFSSRHTLRSSMVHVAKIYIHEFFGVGMGHFGTTIG